MFNAEEAVQLLRSRLAGDCEYIEQLSKRLQIINLLDLHRQYFPEDFATLNLRWSDRKAILDTCDDFIQLVQSHLLPVYSPLGQFDEDDEVNLEYMTPYAPFPPWWEDEEFGPLQRVILQALGEIDESGESIPYQTGGRERSLDLNLLGNLCRKRRGPLSHLALAVKFTFKDTGNLWVDITDEEIGNANDWPEWNKKNIDRLAGAWKAASKIYGKFRRLEKWMEERREREQSVRRLIDQAMTSAARG